MVRVELAILVNCAFTLLAYYVGYRRGVCTATLRTRTVRERGEGAAASGRAQRVPDTGSEHAS